MSFLDPCHWSDFNHLSCGPWEDTPEYDDSAYEKNPLFYHREIEVWFIVNKKIKESLEIKKETNKAILFEIGKYVFWAPKKLIKTDDSRIYIHKCFDIEQAIKHLKEKQHETKL